ncbi:MAG TPA: hypothetical protein VGM90_38170 [Kofleriaceae bacterium]|jgi:hypothetical protein
MRATLPVLALSLLAGCPDRTIAAVPVGQNNVEVKDIPVTINRDLDILFLIDKSPTMKDEQAALTANFGHFMQILSGIDGGLPNVHVGVISQDIGAGGMTVGGGCSGKGDDGKLLATARVPGCTAPAGQFISDVAESSGDGTTRIKNYTGTLEDEFSCIATLGDMGCGFEQHLGSLEKALFDQPLNKDFIRPNALLAIIIISDEDDCTADNTAIYDPANSAAGPFADFRCFEYGWECDEGTMSRGNATYTNCRPRENSPYLRYPDTLVDRIKALKADPRDIIVSTLIGPSALSDPQVLQTVVRVGTQEGQTQAVPQVQPSCVNGSQNAFPMPRIAYFAQQFENNTFYSLCNNDLGAGLEKIAETIRRRIGNPCFEADVTLTDKDPQNPGTQLECTVSETTATSESIIPVCKMANATTPAPDAAQPCWYTVPDDDRCASYPTKLKLVIAPENRPIADQSHIHAQCITD